MKFAELNLDPSLLSAIQKLGYEDCTPIQEQAIPPVIEKKDVAGLAQTGTGKTAAFLIPLMERILRARPVPDDAPQEQKDLAEQRAFKDWKPLNFILILVPTRELAEQVQENIIELSGDSGLRGFAIYGGTGYDKQKEALKNGVEFIVATPGRLIDLYKEHVVDLKQVRGVVFDEADRMFDMGFKDDMKFILQRIPRERQFLVFSATLNFDVLNTAYQFGAEPFEINISRDQARAENVKDEIFHVGSNEKPQHLLSVLKAQNPKQAIIFTNFKLNVEKITKFLTDNGIPAMAISSLLTQAQRNRVIEQFKAENHLNILVATDVAARGLDVKGVDLVINYELPMDCESYVHRIGRTGRAGTEGKAFSLVSDKDIDSLYRIEEYLKHKITIGFLETDQLVTEFKSFPSHHDGHYNKNLDQARGGSGGGGNGPRRSGGGDRRDRPPRAGGPQGERGPRRDGNRGPQASGEGRENRRPDDRQRSAGGAQGDRGPRRHDNQKPHEARGSNGNANGPRKPSPIKPRQPQSGGSSRPQPVNRKPVGKVVAQKSIGQKVAGFFKKIFG